MRRVLLCAVLVSALVVVSAAGARVHASSTGQIKVAVYVGKQRADKHLGLSLCAVNIKRATKYGVNKKSIVGSCGNPNSRGVVRMRNVPAGTWGFAAVGGVGSCAYSTCGRYKRVQVHGGRTTSLTWHMPMWG
jgi:hypothetical protein